MAGGKERALRTRIKSVQSTKKITRAMELIAASRIVKAQQRVIAARPYSEKITDVIQNVSSSGAEANHPLLSGHSEEGSVGVVVISADRGLAGGYNANVLKLAENTVKKVIAADQSYGVITTGRKAENYFRYRRYNIDASFKGFSEQPTYDDAKRVATHVLEQFMNGTFTRVELVYTQFLSAGTQLPVVQRLAPMQLDAIVSEASHPQAPYEFEPDPTEILSSLLPRYVEARIYAAMLDSAASELAARQRAMKAATDNATELIKSLTRVMNQARQDSITTEIMEIVSGAEALRSDDDEDLLIDTTHEEELFKNRVGAN